MLQKCAYYGTLGLKIIYSEEKERKAILEEKTVFQEKNEHRFIA